MFNVLQARKIPSKLLMFPDENHVSNKTKSIKPCILTWAIVGSETRKLSGLAQGGTGLDQQV